MSKYAKMKYTLELIYVDKYGNDVCSTYYLDSSGTETHKYVIGKDCLEMTIAGGKIHSASARSAGKDFGFEYVTNEKGDMVEIQNKYPEDGLLLTTIVKKIGELRDRADFVSARKIDVSIRKGAVIGAFNSKGASIKLNKKLEAETVEGGVESFEERKIYFVNYELKHAGQMPEFKEYATESVSTVGQDRVSVLNRPICDSKDVRFKIGGRNGSMNADVFYFYRGMKEATPQVARALELEGEVMDLRKAVVKKPCLRISDLSQFVCQPASEEQAE